MEKKLVHQFFCLVFLLLLNFSSAVELAHAFVGHEHPSCTHYSDSHFHQDNVECELFSFQKHPFTGVAGTIGDFSFPVMTIKYNFGCYSFPPAAGFLAFRLRGPPTTA